MPKILLRPRRCNACESIFSVCSHCDRGQRYCSDLCRKQARQEQRRAANRRHQQTALVEKPTSYVSAPIGGADAGLA